MITSEKVLRKMNEIQSKGTITISDWYDLRRWLLEDEQIQEHFVDAVKSDMDMTENQKDYWLSHSLIEAIDRYRGAHSAYEASGERTSELNDSYANLIIVCDKVKQAGETNI